MSLGSTVICAVCGRANIDTRLRRYRHAVGRKDVMCASCAAKVAKRPRGTQRQAHHNRTAPDPRQAQCAAGLMLRERNQFVNALRSIGGLPPRRFGLALLDNLINEVRQTPATQYPVVGGRVR